MSFNERKRRLFDLAELGDARLLAPSTSSMGSAASTVVSSPEVAEDFHTSCPICGDGAWNKHFGVLCCNACAAFFRRTVALRKTYLCVRGKRCDVVSGEPRHMCKFCRFQRCIWNGMCINAVFSRPGNLDEIEEVNEKDLLRSLVHCKNATFVERFGAAIKVNDGKQEQVQFGQRFFDGPHTVRTSQAEYMVMMNYLKMVGFQRFGLGNLEMSRLGASLFYQWLCFHSVSMTLRNGGHNINELFFVDESHRPVTEPAVIAYVESFKPLLDADQVRDGQALAKASGHCLDYSRAVLQAAQKLHRARLDDTELAVMLHIMAVKMAIRVLPENAKLNPHLDAVFECMRTHYETNFDDVAVRMGQLILLINEVETVTFRLEMCVVTLLGLGYRSVLGQVIHAQMLAEQYRATHGPYSPPTASAASTPTASSTTCTEPPPKLARLEMSPAPFKLVPADLVLASSTPLDVVTLD